MTAVHATFNTSSGRIGPSADVTRDKPSQSRADAQVLAKVRSSS